MSKDDFDKDVFELCELCGKEVTTSFGSYDDAMNIGGWGVFHIDCMKKCVNKAYNKEIFNVENHIENETITRPSHYCIGKFETIDVLQNYFHDDPLLWNAGKYILRSPYKGKQVEDLKKCKRLIDYKLKELEDEGTD